MADPEEKRGLASDKVGLSTKAHLTADSRIEKSPDCLPIDSLKPDFKTIADFRSDNHAAFKKVFREFVILCRRLDLFGRELLAVDGTRIKAVNNKDRNFAIGSLQKFIAAVADLPSPILGRCQIHAWSSGRIDPKARTSGHRRGS